MTFRKILAGVDGSAQARKAVETAADLAQRYDASLLLFHAVTLRRTSRMQADLKTYQRVAVKRPVSKPSDFQVFAGNAERG